jgi:hypothetical protein
MSWTIPLVLLSVASYLADNQTVMAWIGATPYPWGPALGTALGVAAVIKRYWVPSSPTPAQFLDVVANPVFLDRVLKLAERKIEKPADIVIRQKDGTEFRISSDIPQIGDIPGGGGMG